MKKDIDLPTYRPAGFTGRKHAQALEAARALLAVPQPSIFDSLNCGKLAKLVGYLRTGVPGLLLVCCYSEYAFR